MWWIHLIASSFLMHLGSSEKLQAAIRQLDRHHMLSDEHEISMLQVRISNLIKMGNVHG